MSEYAAFFERVVGVPPFEYQRRIGEASAWPAFIEAPTGAGKTAAVIVAWLWHRQVRPAEVSRRLVYCLPMRVLVDQIAAEARRWCEAAGLDADRTVHVLRGGQIEESWEGRPEEPAILIGTQDQLLSRALNRGYAMNRFRWPMHFALLHNDAWWVFDEVQLMGAGLRCGAQLEGARRRLGAYGIAGSTFMSATLRPEWTRTPDLGAPAGEHIRLSAGDETSEVLNARRRAQKPLAMCSHGDVKALAPWLAGEHRPGTLSLVVVNQVKRAQELGRALEKLGHAPVLLHSRLRARERGQAEALLRAEPGTDGRIVVATQTVEAGVDISCELLVTDLAPWPSLVQRFGRCNRRGEQAGARIFWIDRDPERETDARPYDPSQLVEARAVLASLNDARIDELPAVELDLPVADLPRLRDIEDLFDTDADLDGNFLDISRWIRGSGDTDVAVYWRDLERTPSLDEPAPHPDELCPVGVHALRDFLKRTKGRMFWFDALEKRWVAAHTNRQGSAPGFIAAGQRYLIAADAGGYHSRFGWDGTTPRTDPVVVDAPPMAETAYADDHRSAQPFVSLETHLRDTARAAEEICDSLALLNPELRGCVVDAAGYHDVGKAHSVFQMAMLDPKPPPLLAKAPAFRGYERRGFRHELVSALVAIAHGRSDLLAYLVAAHHGKVRRSIRPLRWSEELASNATSMAVRGVHAGDHVPAVETPMGRTPAVDELPLAIARLGSSEQHGPSWADRVERLLETHGPFRLAYLETLVRAADWRASAAPSETLERPNA